MRGSLVLVLGVMAAGGCGDDGGGTSITPSVSGVFPANGFSGRTTRIEVSGDATVFAAGATIDLGPGATVSNVTVASPTALFADVAFEAGAALGDRDVTVKNGSDTFTLSKAFELDSPITVTTSGTFAQGSVATIIVKNHDLEHPFTATCTLSLFGQCFQYGGITLTVPGGVNIIPSFVGDNDIQATVFIDTDATGGALSIVDGEGSDALTSQPADALAITARTAIAATTTQANVNIPNPGDSALYSFAATGASIAQAAFDTTDDQNASNVYILPSSGHFADQIGSGVPDATGVITASVVTKTANSYFAVYVDDGFQDPTKVKSNNIAFATTITETEPNNVIANAQNLASLPALVDAGSLASISDLDWFKYTIAAGDAGKKIHVITTGGDDGLTDTVVDVLKADGTTTLGGPSDDNGYGEDFVSTATVAGINYIQISASSFFQAAHKNYLTAIYLE